MSKRLIFLASAFSVFMAVGTVAHAQNKTSNDVSIITSEQQKKAQAELDHFSKLTPQEQNQYMEASQKQADEQLQKLAGKLTPEQKTVLENQRIRAKLESARFSKMSSKQRKAYLQNMQEQLNQMSTSSSNEQKAAE